MDRVRSSPGVSDNSSSGRGVASGPRIGLRGPAIVAQQQCGHAFVTNACVGKTHIPLLGSHDAKTRRGIARAHG